MTLPSPPLALGALRAAISVRLQAIPDLTVVAWPALAQHLVVSQGGCVTIGVPSHTWLGDPRDADVHIRSWLWESRWPLTLYVPVTTSSTSTDRIDEVLGRMVQTIRSDYSLGGNATAAGVTDATHDLNDEDAAVRMHVVTIELVVTAEMPD